MSINIGIDFGTSTTLVGIGGGARRSEVIPIGVAGQRLIPSVVAASGNELLVGERASIARADETLLSVKTAITTGRQNVTVGVGPKALTLPVEEVIAAILGTAADRAFDLGFDAREPGVVRLGCPASWTGEQRKRLILAAELAGIEVGGNTLIDEPIATGVAWAVEETRHKGSTLDGTALIYDIGGGTLDIAVLTVSGSPHTDPEISVRASVGSQSAGDAMDAAIARDLENTLRGLGIEVSDMANPALLGDLILRGAREAKEYLSQLEKWDVTFAYPDLSIPAVPYTRDQLEHSLGALMKESERWIGVALREARTSTGAKSLPSELRALTLTQLAGDVDYVLLAGGPSQIPLVRKELARLFPNAAIHESTKYWRRRSACQEFVVRGLSETVSYERLNLLRPGFDFVLEWENPYRGDSGSTVLYEAYTPFHDPELMFQSNMIDYVKRFNSGDLPVQGTGTLRAQSTDGKNVPLVLLDETTTERGPEETGGYPISLGGSGLVFRMSADGEVLIHDGRGRRHHLRIDKWPILKGTTIAKLRAHLVHDQEKRVDHPRWLQDT